MRREASHGMSGWSQTTTARRAEVASTRGEPKKSCPSSSVLSLGPSPRVDSATTVRTGRDAPSAWTSRTARTQSPSGVALSPPWLWAWPSGAGAVSGCAGAAGPSQNHTR